MGTTAGSFERPRSLGAALGLLGRSEPRWTVLAGGTDIYPALANEATWGAPAPRDVLDITAVEELAQIDEYDDAYRIGCLVTWTQLVRSALPGWFEGLPRTKPRTSGGRSSTGARFPTGPRAPAGGWAGGLPGG